MLHTIITICVVLFVLKIVVELIQNYDEKKRLSSPEHLAFLERCKQEEYARQNREYKEMYERVGRETYEEFEAIYQACERGTNN